MIALEERSSVQHSLLGKEESLLHGERMSDSCLVQLVKRLYVISPLFAMAFSTINQVFNIGSK